MAKQPDEDGSSRSLILSLLLDHALRLHPEQSTRIENHLPAYTVGSLRQFSQGEALLELVRSVIAAENVAERLMQLAEKVKAWFPLAPSGKHMSGRGLGRQEPTPSRNCSRPYSARSWSPRRPRLSKLRFAREGEKNFPKPAKKA